ncbi:MAG: hypothetical protein LC792_13355 [Actinobacteria bacterium]|nr:hypothetical protein [Actinomycetota bacterium]
MQRSSQGRAGRFLWTRLTVAAAALVLAVAPAASATPGTIDVSFGVGGALRTNFGGTYDWAFATAIQPDGRILAAGVSEARGTYDFALARYTPNKDLDPTFGVGGVVLTDFGHSYDWAYALALQPDGKIVVGGVSDASGSKDFALARYLPNGALDAKFGDGGLVTDDLRSLTADIIHGIAIQPDGRIVAAGVSYEDVVTLQPHGDFMVARFTPDGDRDLTFGVGGVVTTDFGDGSYDEPYAVVLQPDGKVVLGGYTNSGGGSGALFGADQLALARYMPRISSLVLQPDGKIIAGGQTAVTYNADFAVFRYDARGNFDPTFGRSGVATFDFQGREDRVHALALQPDGKIVAVGQSEADFALVRFNAS